MSFPNPKTLEYMQKHEEQDEEEEQLRQQEKQTYAGAGYGHRLCIPLNTQESLEQQIPTNFSSCLQDIYRTTGLIPKIQIPGLQTVESSTEVIEKLLAKSRESIVSTLTNYELAKPEDSNYQTGQAPKYIRHNQHTGLLGLLYDAIRNSELIMPLETLSLFSTACILGNSAVNSIAYSAPNKTHCIINENYRKLNKLQALGAPLTTVNNGNVLVFGGQSKQARYVWEYGHHKPLTEYTLDQSHKSQFPRYQQAVNKLVHDLHSKINYTQGFIIARQPDSYTHYKLHQQITATAIMLTLTHNQLNPDDSIAILADRHNWQAFIETALRLHGLESKPITETVYYDNQARQKYQQLLKSNRI